MTISKSYKNDVNLFVKDHFFLTLKLRRKLCTMWENQFSKPKLGLKDEMIRFSSTDQITKYKHILLIWLLRVQ